jgi:hypothetical protein
MLNAEAMKPQMEPNKRWKPQPKGREEKPKKTTDHVHDHVHGYGHA